MDRLWSSLYKEAKKRINSRELSPFIEYGNNVCTILSENEKIYFGVSVTSNTAIKCSAEKNAILMMLNSGESKIKRMVILNELEEVIPPSEECLSYLTELNYDLDKIEILINYEKEKVVTLKELLPAWWGTYRNKK